MAAITEIRIGIMGNGSEKPNQFRVYRSDHSYTAINSVKRLRMKTHEDADALTFLCLLESDNETHFQDPSNGAEAGVRPS